MQKEHMAQNNNVKLNLSFEKNQKIERVKKENKIIDDLRFNAMIKFYFKISSHNIEKNKLR